MRKSGCVMGLLLGVVATADEAGAQNRAWVDVNLGVAIAAERDYTAAFEETVFSERARFSADYEWSAGATVDVGGGFMFTPQFGAGATISGTAHRGPAAVAVTIPHPRFFNASATDTSESGDDLERIEGVIHLQGVFAIPTSDRVRVRFFGGPSYFQVTQDTVDNIRYDQVFGLLTTANTVTITDVDVVESEGSAWGFHVGGDVSLFFNRIVGIGGYARYSRAEVELDDFDGSDRKSKAGGFQAGIGLRLRF